MPKPENIVGKGFEKYPERINRKGRPPKLLTTIVKQLKEKGYERVTHTTVVESFEILLNIPEDEIKAMIADKKAPMSIRIVGKAMLSAKGFEILQAMYDRAHGKSHQSMDLSGKSELRIIREIIK